MINICQAIIISVLFYAHAYAQDVTITVGDVTFSSTVLDTELLILLTKEPFTVTVPVDFDDTLTGNNTTLYYSVLIDGKPVDSDFKVIESADDPPSEITSRELSIDATGDISFQMDVWVDENDKVSGYGELFSITGFTTMVPLIFVVFFAVVIKNVYVSLFIGIWLGSFILAACSFRYAFEMALGTYILESAASVDHQFVILFTVFLSGMVFLIQRSGGTNGFSTLVSKLAKSGKLTQWACFLAGLLFFFDDYANALVVGSTFQPLTDMYHISREKLAFLVDATSAPDASIVPLSSWIGFELGQIQEALDKIKVGNGGIMPDGLTDNAFVFFVVTIPTRFYPIYMLIFQMIIMGLSIEFGPMLIAERLCRVNKRTDGGKGSSANTGAKSDENEELTHSGAEPAADTPGRWWNMVIPILMLTALILGIIINSGSEAIEDDPTTEMNARNIFANSDPWGSLLYGTFGASIFTIALIMVQFKYKNNIVPPSIAACKSCLFKKKNNEDEDEVEDDVPVPLVAFPDAIETWINGIAFMAPAVAILILVWAIGAIMTDIGADRYFTRIIGEDINPNDLPTLVFIMAALLSAATGTSWGTMTIMFPLVSPATWAICGPLGDRGVRLYTITLSQILSGSIFGDHSSPLSDTTLLSSVASRCDLFRHVYTQMPYAIWVAFFSIITGTQMVGDGVSTGGTLVLGILVIMLCTWIVGAPVLAKTGRYDLFTELYIYCLNKFNKCKCMKSKETMEEQEQEERELELLKKQTIVFVRSEDKEDMDLMMKFLELTRLIVLFQKCGFGVEDDKDMAASYSKVNVTKGPLNSPAESVADTVQVVEEEEAGDGTHPDDDLL